MNDDNYYKEQLNQLSVKVDELTAYKQKNFDIYILYYIMEIMQQH